MYSAEYIKECIIARIDTQQNRREGAAGNRNFTLSQQNINRWGKTALLETIEFLEGSLPEWVTVKWVYSPSGKKADVRSFTVRIESLEELYKLIGQKSTKSILNDEKSTVFKMLGSCRIGWLKEGYYNDLLARLEHGTFLPDYTLDPCFDLALNLAAENKNPVYLRQFSMLTGHSKKIEKEYKKELCNILRKYAPDISGCEQLSDNDVLRSFNILTYSVTFEFKGPSLYDVDGTGFSTVRLTTGVLFNTDTLLKASFTDFPGVKKVVTIENKANFYAQEYADDTLYVFVHGFLSPCEVNICRQIYSLLPDASYEHWGDLDYGGIRIFRFLQEKVFPTVQPLHMGAEDYLRYLAESPGLEISSSSLEKLKSFDAGPLDPLKEEIVLHKKIFEQESMLWWDDCSST